MWGGQADVRDADALVHRVHGELPDRRDHRRDARVAAGRLRRAQDTYFVVAHMHYVLGGGSLFAIFAGVLLLVPEDDRLPAERTRSARSLFWLTFIGFNLTFWPLFVVRAARDAAADRRLPVRPRAATTPNLLSTLGVVRDDDRRSLLFLVNRGPGVPHARCRPATTRGAGTRSSGSRRRRRPSTTSTWLPPIRSERPVFDWRHRDDPAVEEPVGAAEVKTESRFLIGAGAVRRVRRGSCTGSCPTSRPGS